MRVCVCERERERKRERELHVAAFICSTASSERLNWTKEKLSNVQTETNSSMLVSATNEAASADKSGPKIIPCVGRRRRPSRVRSRNRNWSRSAAAAAAASARIR